MGLYEVPLSMSLLGFGMGTMLANLLCWCSEQFSPCSLGMRVQEGLCVLGA